jgi:uncharacterized delta-60 repeat protein
MRSSIRTLCHWLLAASALASVAASAQPTALDPGFDLDGERENPFPGLAANAGGSRLLRLGLDHDERILLGGDDGDFGSGSGRGLIGRLLPNGSADPAWAGSGVSVLNQRVNMRVSDLVALPDGGALVCGDYRGSNPTRRWVFVARFLADGHLDGGFAANSSTPGIYFAELAGFDDFDCRAIELLADGRVMVAGGSFIAAQQRVAPALMRLTSTGVLDPTFASVGYVRLNVDGDDGYVNSLVEQPGLGLVVWLHDFSSLRYNVLRLRLDGSPDSGFLPLSFVGDLPIGSPWLYDNGLRARPDAHIDIARPAWTFTPQLVTYYDDRQVDGLLGSFAVTLAATAGQNLLSESSALGPDGETVFSSVLRIVPDNCRRQQRFLHLARRLANGNADVSFGSNGQHSRFPLFPEFHPSACEHGVDRAGDLVFNRAGRILSASTIVQGFPNPAAAAPTVERPLLTRMLGTPFLAPRWDIDPSAISFTAASARPSAQAVSNVVTVAGLGSDIHVPAYVTGGELRRNGGAWSRLPTMVRNGDLLRVRALAPTQAGHSAIASLWVGGIRGQNGWASLGPRQRADFVVTTDQPALPGVRCTTSSGSNCTAAIPDNGAVDSSINLINSGSCNYITGVRVGVDLAHDYIGDLRITLTDPNGQVFIGGSEGIVSLADRVPVAGGNPGSCGLRDIIATYADDALREGQFGCGQPLTQPGLSGELRPAQALSQLVGRRTTGNNGASSTGAWVLRVQDAANGDSGQLRDWSLDLSCSASAPALSDLGASVSGPAAPLAGSTVNLSWTITNHGPVATSNGRFQASLPTGLTDSLDNPAWGCSTSAGGSCTPLVPCFGACVGAEIDAALSLPAGGTATFFATGTLTELAGDGLLTVNGRVWTPLAVGGTRDPNPLNDTVQYQAPIARQTNLGVDALSHAWQDQTLTVTAVVGNAGPSQASGFAVALDLPDGLTVQTATCDRGPLPCGGFLSLGAGNLLTLTGAGLLPNRTPMTFVVTAQWAQTSSPGSVQAQVQTDANASDPQPANNQASQTISAPPVQTPIIFQNGFE